VADPITATIPSRSVDNTSSDMKTLCFIRRVLPHRKDGVLAAPPDALDVDLHRKIPDMLFGL
jgi:hypothetical protein